MEMTNEAPYLISLVVGNPELFGLAAVVLIVFLRIKWNRKKAPQMKECSKCKIVWLIERITITEKKALCPLCIDDLCEERRKENYRRAKEVLT